MAKFTCPYCIRTYNLKEVQYVCPDCGMVSTPRAGEKEPIKCKNPDCGGLATLRRCPKCESEIPGPALETPNLPFSIIGVSNAGKTNYITVMLHELGRVPGLRLALAPQNKETRDHQNFNYSELIEYPHHPAEGTAAGEARPQIWQIKNLGKRRGNTVPTYTFTIFDGAGEDHENNMDPSSTVCRYINTSEAIILALDPLILPNIRRGGVVDPTVLRNSLGGEDTGAKNAVDVVNSVAAYIKAARGIKNTKMLNIPVAVVLTKFDTILEHNAFPSNALVKDSSLLVSNGKFNKAEMQQIDQEIRNWLYEIDEGSFIDALEANFKEFYFFGVSSFGSSPNENNELNMDIQPHRVLDPIMWLFHKKGFID